jgi:hypothetical protein
MPYGKQVKLPSVDARGRTWNTRLRRPVLCPLSYVDRVQRGSGAVRTPEAHWAYPGSSRAPQPSGSLPRTGGRRMTAEGVGLEPTQRPGRPNGVANRPLDQLGYPSEGAAVITTKRREWDSNPRTGAARLPPFQGGPFSSLGISPCLVSAGLAEDGRVELPGRLVAGRPLSKRVGSPHAQALLTVRAVAASTRFELAVFALTGRRGLHSPTRP